MIRKISLAVGVCFTGLILAALVQAQAPRPTARVGSWWAENHQVQRAEDAKGRSPSPPRRFTLSDHLGSVTKRITGHGYAGRNVPASSRGVSRPLVRDLRGSSNAAPRGNRTGNARLATHFETDAENTPVLTTDNLDAASRLKVVREAKLFDNLPGLIPGDGAPVSKDNEATAQPLAAEETTEPPAADVQPQPQPQPAGESSEGPKTVSIPTEPQTQPGSVTEWNPIRRGPAKAINPQQDTSQTTGANREPVSSDGVPAATDGGPAAEPLRLDGHGNGNEHGNGLRPERATGGTAAAVLKPQPDPNGGLLFSSRSPALAVETSGPQTIVVGKPATYTVAMRNAGDADAVDVVVQVGVPSWAEVVETQPSFGTARFEPDDQDTSVVKWHLDRLARRGSQKLAMKIVPRDSRPFDLSVGWTFTPEKSLAHIQVQEPKLEIDVIGPQEVLYGETKVYTVTLRNPGTGDTENVVLQLLPIVPDEKLAGSREIGTIKAGSRRVIEIELAARQAGHLQVKARAMADGGLRSEASQEVIVRRANLEIEVEGPPMKFAGTTATYTIRVANSGDAAAEQIVAKAMLPAGAKYITSTDGGRFDEDQGRVEWPVGILRPGAVRELQLQCVLVSPGENRFEIKTQGDGEISAAQSMSTTVESLADLKLYVNDPQGAVAVGADSTYEVKVVNRGTKAAENIVIVGYFSEGIEPMAVQGWRGEIESGQVVFERIARLGPGQEMAFTITAQATRPGNHVFRAELECTNPETRLAGEEWTRFFGEAEPIRQATRKPVGTLQPAPPQEIELLR